jgi:hypothetical protein
MRKLPSRVAGTARVLLCLVVLGSFALFASGCDEGTNVKFKNQTNTEVIVWEGSVEQTRLEPGESKALTIFHFPETITFRVTNRVGNTLFEGTYTFDELKDSGDIVVTEPSPSPSPP